MCTECVTARVYVCVREHARCMVNTSGTIFSTLNEGLLSLPSPIHATRKHRALLWLEKGRGFPINRSLNLGTLKKKKRRPRARKSSDSLRRSRPFL